MKKRKKILVVCLVVLVLLVLAITGVKIWSLKEAPTSQEIPSPLLDDFKQIDACIDEEKCPNVIIANYADIKFDYDNEDIQQWIDNINKETNKYYHETLNSNPNEDNCPAEIKENFKYGIITESEYYIYTGERYISLSVRRFRTNLCTNEKTPTQIDVYLYDKKLNKRITQDELKKELNVSNQLVAQSIVTNIQFINMYHNKELTLTDTYKDGVLDYVLYYNFSGDLMASYYQNSENTYYSTVVLDK